MFDFFSFYRKLPEIAETIKENNKDKEIGTTGKKTVIIAIAVFAVLIVLVFLTKGSEIGELHINPVEAVLFIVCVVVYFILKKREE